MNNSINIEVGQTRLETNSPTLARSVLEFVTGLERNDPKEFDALIESISPPAIGELWPGQGGIYAGLVRGENGNPDYHLIVSTAEAGTAQEIQWGGHGENEDDAGSEWDGLANTRALIASKHSHPAAEWAGGLSIQGLNDWYLPARRELALCYANVPEQFEKKWYWSSTQFSPVSAWLQGFGDGSQGYGHKDNALRARAVRRFVNHSTL